MDRYQRQMMLPEIGVAGQQKLAAARVLVVGAGGLGATLLPQLVGAGVGFIRLCDDDEVALHNLHRQTLFTMQDIGYAKVERAQQALQQRNPEVKLEVFRHALSGSDLPHILSDIDVVIDAADNFAVTYPLSDACLQANIPFISASVLGRQGYVGGFCGSAPSYRAVFPSLPSSAANCNTAGVMGPAVATLGAMQAQMALSVLLGLQPSPLGCVVNCDFVNWHFRQFRFDGAEEPEQAVPFIDQKQLAADDCVVELRGLEEAPDSVAAKVERILPQALAQWQPPQDQRIVLVCASGIRAAKAAADLAQRGFTRLAILAARRP
ncbi:ThiF family adenylyltransferase [Candidatus Pantoea formicae]|uniref:HesA/MoeB/ThiF family protein n=1 Tax=Candidatus Pantoea formicae TaxID=2608355 RepID=UPI003ED8BE0F